MPPGVTPPPFVRRPTGEMEMQLAQLSSHISGLASELANERAAREKSQKQGISITDISVPLMLVIVAFGAVMGAVIAGGLFYHETTTHIADTYVHADRNKAIQKDGVAYNRDLKEAIASEASDRDANIRRVERAVKGGAQCKPSKVHGEWACAFTDPELLKLRPP